MKDSEQIKIIPYSKDFKDDLISFMSLLWKDMSELEKKERFEWRYELNPTQLEDYMLMAVSGDKIVGFRSFVVQDFICNQKTIKILSGADGVVHPDYRKLGLLKRFNAQCIELFSSQFSKSEGIIIILTANKIATIANLKQGWIMTTGLKKYAYKISLINIFKTLVLKKDRKVNNKQRMFRNVSIDISTDLKDEILAEYFMKKRPINKLMNLRTSEYYRWRYTEKGGRNLSFIYAYKKDQMAGYMIIEKISEKQSVLKEYGACHTSVLSKMIDTAIMHLNIWILRCPYTSQSQENDMVRSGCFVEKDAFLKLLKKERLPVLVRPNVIHPENKDFFYDGLDIRDIENWYLQFADGH